MCQTNYSLCTDGDNHEVGRRLMSYSICGHHRIPSFFDRFFVLEFEKCRSARVKHSHSVSSGLLRQPKLHEAGRKWESQLLQASVRDTSASSAFALQISERKAPFRIQCCSTGNMTGDCMTKLLTVLHSTVWVGERLSRLAFLFL